MKQPNFTMYYTSVLCHLETLLLRCKGLQLSISVVFKTSTLQAKDIKRNVRRLLRVNSARLHQFIFLGLNQLFWPKTSRK